MNDGFLLGDAERERFAHWLENQIESSRGMLSQFEKLSPQVAELMTAKEKREMAACVIVLNMIRNGESFPIARR